ncbi:hypothetical protein RRG08_034772 [Elysia crispata]|uniref:Uncharacterized protein n=1 Tax=Elysia crispata TaxID=231223 RepID=A0AAE1CVV0_9GAST|nr:hypothetical protein RRG08_034772 [Elysia crispata]
MGCSESVYIYTRSDGKLYNIALLRAYTKVTEARRLSLYITHRRWTTAACHLPLPCLQGVWTNHHPEEDNVTAQGPETPPNIAIGKSLRTSLSSDPPSPARCQSTRRSTEGSPRQPLSWPS